MAKKFCAVALTFNKANTLQTKKFWRSCTIAERRQAAKTVHTLYNRRKPKTEKRRPGFRLWAAHLQRRSAYKHVTFAYKQKRAAYKIVAFAYKQKRFPYKHAASAYKQKRAAYEIVAFAYKQKRFPYKITPSAYKQRPPAYKQTA